MPKSRVPRQLTPLEIAAAGQFAHALDLSAIVAVTDSAGRITYCNQRFCEVSGYSAAELIGSTHRIINSGVQPPGFFADMWSRITRGEVWRGTICNRRKDGALYWVDTTIVPDRRRDGSIAGYTAIRNEVTEHIKALEALAEARARAETAAAAKDQFIATMSHEVRTPLNGVIGVASALAATPLTAEQHAMLDLIMSSGHALERIVDDVLDLAKLDAGQMSLEHIAFDLPAQIRISAEPFAHLAANKALSFEVDIAPSAMGRFLGDPVRLGQVVANLVSNAVKFTESGGVSVKVAFDGAELRIDVADTGVGFPAEVAERLFERFTQAEASIARRYGGTGLGLSICRSIVQQMGGEISAASEPGHGSVFTVRLPLVRAEPAVAEPEPPAQSMAAALPDDRPLRILLAEDHPTNRQVVQMLLAPLDIELVMAEDGAQALDRFMAEGFDAALIDMQMPGVDGLAALRGIRAFEAQQGRAPTPIAMLTANTTEADRALSFQAGADDFIPKPITAQSLLEGLERLLSQPQRRCAPDETRLAS